MQNIDILEFKGSSLLHGDLNMQNIITSNGRIAAIIDAGDAMAGGPMYEIARYQYENIDNFGEDARDGLYLGYGRHDERRVNFYGMIINLWRIGLHSDIPRNVKRYR
ncbi:MAG: phosphotransferase [Candidatus Micrarchaeota archaeon]|nr:phosphotransferase [Candidatus Micrarchaeota archaeon]MDE1848068.1 phosphotransferase [Candidatus Micrarchaeota archaeon]MDE1864877.1 phosphotransferase [Candidatus Micrarchaeota archaeon]